MLKDLLQAQTLSIVIVGDFNPVIIQPFWLANKKLIRETEATSAKVDVVHNDLSQFTAEWLFVQVGKKRFEIRTTQRPFFEPLKDLAVNIFSILKETPVTSFAFNHLLDFNLRDKDEYYEFGNKLAPLSNWKPFLEDPKLLEMVIQRQKTKPTEPKGSLRVTIQPSNTNLGLQFGVHLNINDHYDLNSPTNNAVDFLKMMSENWEASQKEVIDIMDGLSKTLAI